MLSFKLELYRWSDRIIKWVNLSFFIVSIVAIISLVAQYGFYLSPVLEHWLEWLDLLIVLYYVVQFSIKIIFIRIRLDYIRTHWFESTLVVLIVSRALWMIYTLGFATLESYFVDIQFVAVTKVTIISAQVIILLSIISGGLRINSKIASLKFHPAQTLLLSFLVVIILGTGLLMLPRATAPGHDLNLLDAVFTATSATCVTGLIVVDTGSHFSLLGQGIILLLIQIGGLGIMTLSSFLALFFGRGMAIRERVLMQEMLNLERLGSITKILRQAVLLTFSFEAVGAVILFFSWNRPEWTFSEHVYHSLFHAVSAFCNAGFSLNSDSLTGFSSNYLVVGTVAVLIIFGGLGFVVIAELFGGRMMQFPGSSVIRRFSVHTRLVLIISSILLISGAALIFLVDSGSDSGFNHFVQSFFTSVTARTAGFNTVDMARYSTPVLLLIMMLMFIGASPGSTGGGIKTTTMGILFASLVSIVSGRDRIVLFHKSVSYTVLNRALVIFAFSITMIGICTFLLSITETAGLQDILFEEISAFGTVGLSLGLTKTLSSWGRVIIIISMFVGRIGALTLAFAITAPREKLRVEYPQERNIMVG